LFFANNADVIAPFLTAKRLSDRWPVVLSSVSSWEKTIKNVKAGAVFPNNVVGIHYWQTVLSLFPPNNNNELKVLFCNPPFLMPFFAVALSTLYEVPLPKIRMKVINSPCTSLLADVEKLKSFASDCLGDQIEIMTKAVWSAPKLTEPKPNRSQQPPAQSFPPPQQYTHNQQHGYYNQQPYPQQGFPPNYQDLHLHGQPHAFPPQPSTLNQFNGPPVHQSMKAPRSFYQQEKEDSGALDLYTPHWQDQVFDLEENSSEKS
jgi:hypothetical protein